MMHLTDLRDFARFDKPDIRSVDRTPISKLLPAVCTCIAGNLGVDKVTTLFLGSDFSQAPVVDASGQPIGILTKADVLRWHWRKPDAPSGTVADIMRPIPLILDDDTSVARASVMLTDNQVDCAVVVSASGRVAGMVSCHELLVWLRLAST